VSAFVRDDSIHLEVYGRIDGTMRTAEVREPGGEVGDDNLIATPDRKVLIEPTRARTHYGSRPLYRWPIKRIRRLGPGIEVIILNAYLGRRSRVGSG
jgi:hypothetical protein